MELDFSKEIEEKGDPDNSKDAKRFYVAYFKWASVQGMRGDTICSFGTTFGACNKSTNKDLQPLVDGRSWQRGYTRNIFSNKVLEKKVIDFRFNYHSLANFWIMPRTLNTWRGKRDFGDYIDIFLNCIRNYYLNEDENLPKVKTKFNEKVVKNWLNSFGEKAEGWKKFVESNCLFAYVKGDSMEVKDIFSENFKKQNADIVGTYHEYGAALPQNSRKKQQEPVNSAINYVENSLWAINKRADDLKKVKIKK